MSIVVTGGTGHLGTTLVRQLAHEGDRVICVSNDPPDRAMPLVELPGVERVHADVRDVASLVPTFSQARAVIHCAGMVSILERDRDLMWSVNADGTRAVAQACLAAGVERLVHVSSVQALSPSPLDEPLDERRPLVARDSRAPTYDRSKAEAERHVLAAVDRGLDAVIVNPTGIVGPYDLAPSRIGDFIVRVGNGQMPALVDGGFNWVDVRDVAATLRRALTVGRSGERYLASGSWASVRDLAEVVELATGAGTRRMVLPWSVARAAAPLAAGWSRVTGRPPQFTPSSIRALRLYPEICGQKAERDLGHWSRALTSTISDTCRWFAELELWSTLRDQRLRRATSDASAAREEIPSFM